MGSKIRGNNHLMPLKAIQERDVDLLLLEELICNPDFQSWFISKTTNDSSWEKIQAWHSLSEPGMGETDILVKVTKGDNQEIILIENKINAVFQPLQPERYKARGKYYLDSGACTKFCTVLIAPKFYLKSLGAFDFYLYYEDILKWFSEAEMLGTRGMFKAQVIKTAIEKLRRGYYAIADQNATLFWSKYYQYANSNFPELNIQEPPHRIPKLSSFIRFYPIRITEGKSINFIHKFAFGNVDLQLNRMGHQLLALEKEFGSILLPQMSIVKAGKSASFRIKVKKLDINIPFIQQENAVQEALIQLKCLLNWAHEHLFIHENILPNP